VLDSSGVAPDVSFTIFPRFVRIRNGSADPQRTPAGDAYCRPVAGEVRRSQEILAISSKTSWSATVHGGPCRPVAVGKNLLWIRRSVVRVHPAVPARSHTISRAERSARLRHLRVGEQACRSGPSLIPTRPWLSRTPRTLPCRAPARYCANASPRRAHRNADRRRNVLA
jgi:hypothetical protein